MAQHLDYPADLSDLKGERKKEPVPEGNWDQTNTIRLGR